jgi:hypothetical protein
MLLLLAAIAAFIRCTVLDPTPEFSRGLDDTFPLAAGISTSQRNRNRQADRRAETFLALTVGPSARGGAHSRLTIASSADLNSGQIQFYGTLRHPSSTGVALAWRVIDDLHHTAADLGRLIPAEHADSRSNLRLGLHIKRSISIPGDSGIATITIHATLAKVGV